MSEMEPTADHPHTSLPSLAAVTAPFAMFEVPMTRFSFVFTASASLSSDTAPEAMAAAVTALAASLDALTAEEASFSAVTAPSAISSATIFAAMAVAMSTRPFSMLFRCSALIGVPPSAPSAHWVGV